MLRHPGNQRARMPVSRRSDFPEECDECARHGPIESTLDAIIRAEMTQVIPLVRIQDAPARSNRRRAPCGERR
jgi:hypothetical protein